jgi:hypothetical protein
MRHKLRLFNLVLIVVFIFGFTACTTPKAVTETTTAETTIPETTTAETTIPETTAEATIEKVEYNIGDPGPAGGLIFYVNPNYETDGWRYLEAAPGDQSTSIQWCNGNFEVGEIPDIVAAGASGTAVGTGKANTQTIVKAQGSGSYAAQVCNDLTLGGYSDWFLPSKDELDLMYENLHLKGLGGFSTLHSQIGDGEGYWSSSEYPEAKIIDDKEVNLVIYRVFDGGATIGERKTVTQRVRAVRAF